MISALGNTPATGTIYSVSRMRLEVSEAMEGALKATSRTKWIRRDFALSVWVNTTIGCTIVSTNVGIAGCEVIITLKTAGTIIGRGTYLKKEEVSNPKAEIASFEDSQHGG